MTAAKKGEKNPERLPHGIARVQFISNIEEIKDLLIKGYNYVTIYRKLIKENKITMKYRTFYGLINYDREVEKRHKRMKK